MEKITLRNTEILITEVKNSNKKWYFVLNAQGIPTVARVLPPEALEFGARVTTENLSEEDIPRYVPETVNPTEEINKSIAILETVLSRRYVVQTNRDFLGFGWGFRTKATKRALGFDESDREYSIEGKISSDIEEGKITLNYASMPIELEFKVQIQQVEEQEEPEVQGSIPKPKKKFEG